MAILIDGEFAPSQWCGHDRAYIHINKGPNGVTLQLCRSCAIALVNALTDEVAATDELAAKGVDPTGADR